MRGNWSNPKWDKALITVMKKEPDRITMCPNCGHFVIDKGSGTIKQFNRYHKSHGQCITCHICGISFSGKRFIVYKYGVAREIEKYFKNTPTDAQDLNGLRQTIFNSKGIFFIPYHKTPLTL
jgi:hypothetical protein